MDLCVRDMLQSINKSFENVQAHKLVTVKCDVTPAKALTQLAQHKLLSAPVVDESNSMRGVLDVMTIARKIADGVAGKGFTSESANELLNGGSVEEIFGFEADVMFKGFDTAVEPSEKILAGSVSSLIEHIFCHTESEEKKPQPVHRVVMIETNGTPSGIVSETDVLDFIFKYPRVLSLKMWGTLEDIGFLRGTAIPTASSTEPTWSVLRMLAEGGSEAIAIVDERGKLFGSFSETDLRGITAERLATLDQPIGEFLKSIHMPPLPITTVTPKDTLGHLVRLLVEQRQRCAWLVNGENRPIGCVTATDVCLAAYLLGLTEAETKESKKATKLQDLTGFRLQPQAAPFYPHNQIHLMETPIRNVLQALNKGQSEEIYYCLPNDTLEDAMHVMATNRLLSVPVQDLQDRLIGFVDLSSILNRLVRFVEEENNGAALTQRQIDRFCGLPLTEVSTSDFEVVWSAYMDNKVYDVLLPFAMHGVHHGIHRLLVLNPSGTPISILTQSDIVKYAAMQPDILGEKASRTISQLGIVSCNPIVLHENSPVWSGFVQMVRAGVHCLPVVNDKGILIDVLSSSDLRGVKPAQLGEVLAFPTRAFKEAVFGFVGNAGTTPVTATMDTTFQFVVHELADNGVHRIVIVDSDSKPVGVVSLSDVLRCLVTK